MNVQSFEMKHLPNYLVSNTYSSADIIVKNLIVKQLIDENIILSDLVTYLTVFE